MTEEDKSKTMAPMSKPTGNKLEKMLKNFEENSMALQ